MRTRAQKTKLNMALKVALVASRRTQKAIALSTGMGEVRLSQIVWSRGAAPTTEEKRALARVLRTSQAALFPQKAEDVPASAPEGSEATR